MSREASSLAGARVLVTGATGFLGRHLVPRLLRGGAAVFAVSRQDQPAAGDVAWIRSDFQDVSDVARVWGHVRPDLVFHLSGAVDGAPKPALLVPTFQSLLASTVNVLAAAGEHGCRRVVFIGSLEEHDPVDEGRPLSSPYAVAKNAASDYARMCHRVFGTPAVIARIFMGYGPGQPDWKLIPSAILSLLRGEAPRVTTGSREFDWVFIDDAIDALVLSATVGGLEGLTIDIGSGEVTSIRGIIDRVVRLIDPAVRPEFGTLTEPPWRPAKIADIATTQRLLDWTPGTSLESGLLETIRWYASREGLPDRGL